MTISHTLATITAVLIALSAPALPVRADIIDGPEVKWHFSTWGKPRAFTAGVERLAKILDTKTGGRFTLIIYYNSVLSTALEQLDGIKANAFDAGFFCNFYHPEKNPAFMVLSLPFLPLANWDASITAREAVGNHPAAQADLERWNAMFYASTILPQYEFSGTGEPPLQLADWRDRRVRAGGGIGQAMEMLGAAQTFLPAPEVYAALRQEQIDAAAFPFTYAHVAYGIYEVADWFTANLAPGTEECPIVVNKTSWSQLPEQYRQLLVNAKPDVYQAYVEAYEAIDRQNLPLLQEQLIGVSYSDEQRAHFQKIAGLPIWNRWIENNKNRFDAVGLLQLVLTSAKQTKQ